MKIVPIIAERLYAFRYKDNDLNEYDRLLELWNNTEYLHSFLKENENDIPDGLSVDQLAEQITDDADILDDDLIAISENHEQSLDEFFRPLHNLEYRIVQLSLRKSRRHYLRLYAIRIDAGCYVITGGAIKLTQTMDAREHTKKELVKLKQAQSFLQYNDIINEDSFYEFLIQP